MTREELEHIIRAAGTIANVEDVVVIGSQAILGGFPSAPAEFLVSNEADVLIRSQPDRGELIDATIGEGSPFQHSFGYYAHGVDESTAVLPEGWDTRLILVTGENTGFVRGWCLEIHDLAIAKYVAGREKDLDFTRALAKHGMTDCAVLEERLSKTKLEPRVRDLVRQRIRAHFTATRS